MINFLDICLQPFTSIKKTMEVISNGSVKIALVVDKNNHFLGTVSDGDIRRGLLKGKSLDDVIDGIYNVNAICADKELSKKALFDLCIESQISQIPIIDINNQVVDLFILDELFVTKQHKNTVVLMVGGIGMRLMPLTEKIPKPMLKVGNNPILQTIVEGFSKHGFTNFIMCLGYKSDVIQDYFQDGKAFGVNIEYVIDDKPMGTAGALSLLKKKLDKPVFVMNGDILTNINYEELLDFHKSNNAKATMCVREYDIEVPYGVVGMHKEDIISIEEKPIHSFFVNSGIYLLEPECIDLIPNNEFYDMPLLFEKLLDSKEKVVSFPLKEYWIDVGHISQYEQAMREYKKVFNV